MMQPIQFWISGIPKPSGSKRSWVPTNRKTGEALRSKKTGRIVVNTVDANPSAGEWKTTVLKAAQQQVGQMEPWICPVRVDVRFYMPRIKAHFRTGKQAGILREGAPTVHVSKPDRTKLMRGTEDALTGLVWRDDSQIVDGRILKLYEDGRGPGCLITISEVLP